MNRWSEGIKYRRLISQYKYSLCPEGNCIDTHRLWESLYLNTIPIVIYTPMFKYYYKLGIPLLILYSWSDLADLNLDNLNFFYDEHKEWFKNKPLFFNFWKETIQSKIHF